MRRSLYLLAVLTTLVVVGALLLGATAITSTQSNQVWDEFESSMQQQIGAELGVLVGPLNDAVRRRFGTNAPSGVVVLRVLPGSAAEQAGIRGGDVMSRLDGTAIANPGELRNALAGKQPGAAVRVMVQTGSSAPRELQVTLSTPSAPGQAGPQRGPRFPSFGFGQNGPRNTATVVQGTVNAVSASSITITKANSSETATFPVDGSTRVLAGPGRSTVLDLRRGDGVMITTFDGNPTARIIASPDAIRRAMPNLPQRPPAMATPPARSN